ncbi:MAG: DEAD/DEAH box helicase, partial [Pseudomonadota bacterium]
MTSNHKATTPPPGPKGQTTSSSRSHLPIDETLPEILHHLSEHNRLVLAAPPGAGKTTRLPLALLNAPWRDGRILLLEPRRIAARLAAERMASSLGEKVGQTIGLSTRVDRRISDATRIEVITDGLFTRRILSDPELNGTSAVLFDEFHERSINIDLGLALALEAQTAFAENLRIVIMSATLNVSSLASKCASRAIETTGRSFPIKTIYLGKSADQIDQCMEKAVLDALSSQEGSILAFLPGRGEI